ncbi:MAG TPA: complex I NDUFA9 subunit family protein [Burkholderiaceae bacterium]|nr:complex I NDUFA9 subunit family protein [Burkholderiaceae bacterium]
MEYPFVLVLGGSGFIGSHVIAKLSDSGRRVIVPTRHYESAKHLAVLPAVEDVVEADIHDDAVLNRLMIGIDAVINLVGILHSRPGQPYGPDFAKAHVELPHRVVAACAANGVKRYLHMSALGAGENAPSMYLRSKAAGEKAALSNPAVATTVFRPSVVFGEEDRFLNMFASMQRFMPIVPLASGNAKFQPIYVQDVAQAFVNALDNDRTIGKIYELAGPKVYTLHELVRLAGEYSGHSRMVIDMPAPLARLQVGLLELMPGEPIITRDNLASMSVDNVIRHAIDPDLGIEPVALESVAPHYLSEQSKHSHFSDLRNRSRGE